MAINTVLVTNIMALTAHRNLGSIGNKQNKANQRLSSGKKINSAADDAAGLAISEKMKAQIAGLDMASKNSEDAISLIQTAEGSLTEVNNMLTRIRELTVQAGNDTNQQEDRVKIAEEVATLLTEIDSISSRTEFNEKKLNDGTFQDGYFQIGANSNQGLDLSIGNMSVMGTGLNSIMEVFGLEKKIDLTTTSSREGVIDPGTNEGATSGDIKKNTEAISGGLVTIELTDNVRNKVKKLSFNIDVELDDVKSEDEIAEEVIKQLESNKEFSKLFSIKSEKANGKTALVISNNEVGGEISISKIGLDLFKKSDGSKDDGGIDFNFGGGIVGYHGKIDVESLNDGDTVRIGDQVYTKVPPDKVGENQNNFSNIDELKKILEDKKIYSEKILDDKILQVNYADHQNTPIPGTYSVNSKDVSDKGVEYSKVLDDIDDSLKYVTTQRSKLGANQNRLEYTINNLNLSSENLNAAKSRIEDTDMAKEMMNLTKANVLQQAATSILAQANQAPNNITQLLG